jgi:alpha-L-arabinofuranosidase
MYAENQVNELLKFQVTSPVLPFTESGSVGLGTQDTQAEFKDIRVENGKELLLSADKLSKMDYKFGKKEDRGWSVDGGTFTQNEQGLQSVLFNKEISGNYTLSLKARKISGKNGFRIYFLNKSYCDLGGNGNKTIQFDGGDIFWKGGGLTPEQQIKNLSIETNRWYDLRLEVNGYNVLCYVDGQIVNKISLLPVQSLYASAGKDLGKNEIVLKVINVSSESQLTRLRFPGIKTDPKGNAIVITSEKPDAKNSLENPDNIIPRTSIIQNISSDFEYSFPAYSATILRIKAH